MLLIAGLVSKFKKGSLQYTNQLEKCKSKRLYYLFVNTLCEIIDKINNSASKWKPKRVLSPEILFRSGAWKGQFSVFDSEHIPTHDKEGKPLSKARRKKVLKVAAANKRKLENIPQADKGYPALPELSPPTGTRDETSKDGENEEKEEAWREIMSQNQAHEYVKFGVFGNLQSLRTVCDCGPNMHSFNF